MELADGYTPISGEHSRIAGTQLDGRDRDGYTHRAQGRDRGREGSGDDDARSLSQADDSGAGVEVFHGRANQDHEVRAADAGDGQPGDVPQRGDSRQVSAGDAEVLLRSD